MTHEIDSGAQVVDREPRCWRCGKKLAESVGRPWQITCMRCKAKNVREGAKSSP